MCQNFIGHASCALVYKRYIFLRNIYHFKQKSLYMCEKCRIFFQHHCFFCQKLLKGLKVDK